MPQESLSMFQKMMETGFFNYLALVIISMWAGIVRYLSTLNGSRPTILGLACESCISGFVGVISALVCAHFELDFYLMAAITGIAAHNGTRSLTLLGEFLNNRIGK